MAEPIIPLPAGVDVHEGFDGLRITRRWSRAAGAAMLVFACFWDGFLVFWYSIAFTTHAPWIMLVFPLIHVAVGVGITYTGLANLLNTSTIVVGSGRVGVAHGPLPWPGATTVSTSDLSQLYAKERVSRGRNSTSISYDLCAVLQDGRMRPLLKGLDSSEQARYLEAKLERYIGLIDAPVAGELRK